MENSITISGLNSAAILNDLAQEAQMYSRAITGNMLQLGRVFSEAKPLVKRGEWEQWLTTNSGCSVRYAQKFMETYMRFGSNEAIGQIRERTKIFAMLELPEGTEEKFLADNDVQEMTAKAVREAVEKARKEAQREIDTERALREAAEEKANRPAEPSAETIRQLRDLQDRIMSKDDEINRLKEQAEEALIKRNELLSGEANREMNDLKAEKIRLEKELDNLRSTLHDTQEAYDEVYAENQDYQNQITEMNRSAARGDAERNVSSELTADDFMSAVGIFMGAVSTVPYMSRTFAAMSDSEHRIFMQGIETLKGWMEGAEKALNSIEGVFA